MWEAIESDLLGMGFTLDDVPRRVTWRTLIAYTRNAPRGSAVWREQTGDAGLWGDAEYLLAAIVDRLSWLQWAKTTDGQRGKNYPKPVPRPGVVDPTVEKYGSARMTLDQAREWLGW